MQSSEEMVLKSLQKDPSPKPSIPTSRRIVTAGGGAHRLAKLFMDSLTVEVVPFKEMDLWVVSHANFYPQFASFFSFFVNLRISKASLNMSFPEKGCLAFLPLNRHNRHIVSVGLCCLNFRYSIVSRSHWSVDSPSCMSTNPTRKSSKSNPMAPKSLLTGLILCTHASW